MNAVDPHWLEERLREPARELGASLSAGVFGPLAVYAGLVLDWGARVNLTGARTAEALADEHLADALALLPVLPAGPFAFVDVGSGAGLPGIVLALLRRDSSGTLLEPRAKKQAFLAHAIRSLGLRERVVSRAQSLGDHLAAGGSSAYDVAVSRAVWPAADWLVRGLPLLKPGGLLIGFEGAEAQDLPAGCERRAYRIGGRPRAVVIRRA